MLTPRERRDLINKLDKERQELLQAIQQLTNKKLEGRAKPEDRTRKAQLLHLADTELVYVNELARRARDEEEPDLSAVLDVDNPKMFEEASPLGLAKILEKLRAARENTLRFIAETSDSEFDHKGLNTPFGDLTVHQFLKSIYRHDRMHIDEILGQEPTYLVRTTDGRRL